MVGSGNGATGVEGLEGARASGSAAGREGAEQEQAAGTGGAQAAEELPPPAELTVTVMDASGEEREVAFTLHDAEDLLQKLNDRAGGVMAREVFNECWRTILRAAEPTCRSYELLFDARAPPAHRLIRLELLALLAIPPRAIKFKTSAASLSERGATMLAHLWRQAKTYDTSAQVKSLCTLLSEGHPTLKPSSLENTLRAACKNVYEGLFGANCTPSKLPPAETRRTQPGQPPAAAAAAPEEQQQQQAGPEPQQAASEATLQEVLDRMAAMEGEMKGLRAEVASLTSQLSELRAQVDDPLEGLGRTLF